MANTKITNPELFNLGDSTSATQLPVMTTAQRIAMNAPITTPFNIDYLVVAGGGGGGPGYQAGGGGAGGLLTNVGGTGLSLNTSVSYTVTVGAGGAGGASLTGSGANKGSNGSDSQFASLPDAVGGGGGASYWNGSNAFGLDGGSGGGAAYTNFNTTTAKSGGAATAGQGNAGGGVASGTYSSPYKAGGGGGAGSAGINGTPDNGNGGDGLLNNITGTSLFYAAGGGAGGYNSAGSGGSSIGGSGSLGSTGTAPTSGTANTGSGGGGAGNTGVAGAAGGSGIVILRYPTADVASYTATGLTLTETTVGTDTILSFTTVGTGTISFTSSTPTNTISTGEMIFNSTTDKVEYWDGTKWYGITYELPTVQLTFNEMWYSVDSPYNCANNRGTITNTIADFNTYTEGQADYNTSPRTSGKWYIEILQRQSTGHNGYTVFQKSGNTTYNTPPYVSSNPIDGNYGITLYSNGNTCALGSVPQSPTPNLGISNNQVACIAVDVDNQKVWFGKKTSATATSVTWVSGTNPATNTGGYSVGFTEFDPMVSHVSETSSRQSEFGLVDVANFTTPSGFSNWQGQFSSSLTVNCSQH